MIRRCLFCRTSFDGDLTPDEPIPGARVAFDPERGRLWRICGSCDRWSLTAIEERWEAVEALEHWSRDHARLLASTDNVSLLSAGGADVVRIGRAQLREEAWWRYGTQLEERWKDARRVAKHGKFANGMLIFAITGLPLFNLTDGEWWVDRDRRSRFGRYVARARGSCAQCGARTKGIRFAAADDARPARGAEGRLELRFPCERCNAADGLAGVHLRGPAAEHVLRSLLAYRNHRGGQSEDIREAARVIEEAPSAREYVLQVAGSDRPLSHLTQVASLALEIASNDARERGLLQLEVARLREQWAREEELAAIIDGELTDAPGLDRLKQDLS